MPTATQAKEQDIFNLEGPAPAEKGFTNLRSFLDKLEDGASHMGRRDVAETVTAAVTSAARPKRTNHARKERHMETTTEGATTAQAATSNRPTLDEFVKVAATLGEEAAKGGDAQVKFALKLIEGAYLGVLDTTKDKHGKDRTDAFVLCEAYMKARKIATVFDAKPSNQRKLLSWANTYITFGNTPKWGQGEPLNNTNELVLMRDKEKKIPANQGRIQDANNMLLAYIRKQLKRNDLITGDELKGFCFKPGARPMTAIRWFERVRKDAGRLIQGKLANCPESYDGPEMKTLIEAATKAIKAIAKATGQEQAPAKKQAAA